MPKPVVAIDIDDVLSASAEELITYSNMRWGTHLTVADYDEHWGKMWQLEHDMDEMHKRAHEVRGSGIFGNASPKDDAQLVLEELRGRFSITLVTSRHRLLEPETRSWLEKHYDGLIDEVIFAGIYDGNDNHQVQITATKKDILARIGATYFIDDQLKHCYAAAETGIETIVFGNYSWNQDNQLPKNITRCNSWQEVAQYFNGKK